MGVMNQVCVASKTARVCVTSLGGSGLLLSPLGTPPILK